MGDFKIAFYNGFFVSGMMYYVYIIYSRHSDLYYIGHSGNPDKRLFSHNNSERNTFTSKHRPRGLVASFPVSEKRDEALIMEKYLKKNRKAES